jgi:hypothetical protein
LILGKRVRHERWIGIDVEHPGDTFNDCGNQRAIGNRDIDR